MGDEVDLFIQNIARLQEKRQIAEDVQEGTDLQLELSPPPVAALGVVVDCVARPHPDPLRNWSVLFELLGQLDLDISVAKHF